MINLHGKKFSPKRNSEGGRVASDAVFTFEQSGNNFSAVYSGAGFSDGHLIGAFENDNTARLIYHSRAESGALEAGEAKAIFSRMPDGRLTIAMDWTWLNGSRASGQSFYEEI